MSRRAAASLLMVVVALAPTPAWAQRAELAKARTLYNERQFDTAIDAAVAARSITGVADAAAVVEARARLERYRQRADPSDLSAARDALASVRANGLVGRDRAEFLLALGESLFLEDDFGAAAETFDSVLDTAASAPDLYDAALEWWAGAIDRQATVLERSQRHDAYERMRDRMSAEIARDPASPTASYWLVVALRGEDNFGRAWDAAVAGWARARLMGESAATFRADLNRLVTEGVIPDRVRMLPQGERAAAESQFRIDWGLVKEKWK